MNRVTAGENLDFILDDMVIRGYFPSRKAALSAAVRLLQEKKAADTLSSDHDDEESVQEMTKLQLAETDCG